MDEYIKRDAAIEVALSCTDSFEPIEVDITVKSVVEKLRKIPTADVQPVKHGRWVQDAVYVNETTGEPCLAWFCNQCGEPQMVGTNYCPNCGARMDGEKHE